MAAETVRLFFAMQPGLTARETLHRHAEDIGVGRPTPVANIHLTLCFLGSCNPAQQQRAGLVGSRLRPRTTAVHTGSLEYWAGARAVVLLAEPLDDALVEFHAELSQALADAGFSADRRPFRPHLTLLRKVSPAPTLPVIPSRQMPLRGFGLFRSRPGPRGSIYEQLHRWLPTDQG